LLTRTSVTIFSFFNSSKISSPAFCFDKSLAITLTFTLCLFFISLASSFNFVSLRAVITRSYFSFANIFANSKPIPADAPVINAVLLILFTQC